MLQFDDVSMHALSGDFAERAKASFAAGCDVVLHCNGLMEEMRAVAEATPQLSGKALARAQAATALLNGPEKAQVQAQAAQVRDDFNRLVSAVA